MAAVCCAMTSCAAILRRSGESFLRVLRPSVMAGAFSEIAASETFATATAAEMLGAAGFGSGCGFRGDGGVFGRPAPVARLFARASWRRICRPAPARGCGSRRAGAASSIVPTTSPIFTSEPAVTLMRSVPAFSAVISVETLSVSRVRRASPAVTASPSFLCQMERRPLVMDSPTAGILISRDMRKFRIRILKMNAAWGGSGWDIESGIQNAECKIQWCLSLKKRREVAVGFFI